MELLTRLIDLFLHLDKHLNEAIDKSVPGTYLLLFLIVFCETGLVVMPLLPGDSLLFAAGALAATSGSPLNVGLLFLILATAAVLGDTVNYWMGAYIGPKIFRKEKVRFLNRAYLDRAHQFYERYGGKTIIIARFIPIIRTFAPFVAGIGSMTYWRFLLYNFLGGVAWVAICLFAGYWFGEMVKGKFTIVIIAIVLISLLPGIIEFIRQRARSKAAAGDEVSDQKREASD